MTDSGLPPSDTRPEPCCIVTMLVLVSTHTDFYGNWPLDSQVKRGQTDRQTDKLTQRCN